MKDYKVTIPYQIKAIRPSELKEGYVEVVMEPVDKFEYNHEDSPSPPPITVTGIGPGGTPFPAELQHQLSQMMKQVLPPGYKGKKSEDPRSITHVESEIDFLARNWKYGDIINVTLEKVKTAEEVEQTKE
jgi:hypothetical protein